MTHLWAFFFPLRPEDLGCSLIFILDFFCHSGIRSLNQKDHKSTVQERKKRRAFLKQSCKGAGCWLWQMLLRDMEGIEDFFFFKATTFLKKCEILATSTHSVQGRTVTLDCKAQKIKAGARPSWDVCRKSLLMKPTTRLFLWFCGGGTLLGSVQWRSTRPPQCGQYESTKVSTGAGKQ